MKKYTKPTAEVIELSVRESLSDLPGNMKIGTVTKRVAGITTLTTTYNVIDSREDWNAVQQG